MATNISYLKDNASYFCSFSHLSLFVHDVIVYDCVDVLHSAFSRFHVISVEYLVKGVVFWEMDINMYKKDRPILVVTLLLRGRLNHITFHWGFLFLFSWLLAFGVWQATLSM